MLRCNINSKYDGFIGIWLGSELLVIDIEKVSMFATNEDTSQDESILKHFYLVHINAVKSCISVLSVLVC